MNYVRRSKKEEFTPGKWTEKEWVVGKSRHFFIQGKNQKTICYIYESKEHKDRAEANATLIASAPDMYYTLQNLVLDLHLLRYVKDEFELNRKILEMISTAEDTLKKSCRSGRIREA